jgi:hypothetical protein
MKTYGGVEEYIHALSPSASIEVSGQFHAPAALPPWKEPLYTHWIGGWVGLRVDLDAVVKRKIPYSSQESNPGRPARSLVTISAELSWLLRLKSSVKKRCHFISMKLC